MLVYKTSHACDLETLANETFNQLAAVIVQS